MGNFKIVSVARKKANLVKIGTSKDDAEWFFLSEPVVKFLGGKDFVGKELEGYEAAWSDKLKGQLVSKVYLSKPNSKPVEKETKKESTPTQTKSKPVNYTGVVTKSVSSIEIAKVTAQTIQSMQGFVEPNTVKDIIEIVYNTYKNLINA